jgi:hypothetical protein
VAKRRSEGGVNKSEAIREILAQNPKIPVRELVAQLGQRGIKVNPNLVYLIKSKQSKKVRRQRRMQAVEANRQAGISNPVELIRDLRGVAEKAGGMKRLKELVDLLVS